MGEYIRLKHRNITVKLGTCENLYYVRHAELKRWVESGIAVRQPGNLEPAAYLDPAHGFRFRFPFPDEDGVELTTSADANTDFDRGYAIAHIPYFLLPAEHHAAAWANIETTTGAQWPRRRFRTLCPQAAEANAATVDFELVQQKPVGDALRLVVRCPYCRSRCSVEAAEGVALADWMLARCEGKGEWAEIARRIQSGYGVEVVATITR